MEDCLYGIYEFLKYRGGVLPITTTLYGTCDTAASTATKMITCSNFDQLADGFRIAILFTYGNTTGTVYININNTSAVQLDNPRVIDANELVDLIYINSKFHIFYQPIPKKLSDLTDDVVTGNYLKLANNTGIQTVVSSASHPIDVERSGATTVYLGFKNSDGLLGLFGVSTDNKPIFEANGAQDKEIALKDDVVKLTNAGAQTIANASGSGTAVLYVKSNTDTGSRIVFQNSAGSNLGSLGVGAANGAPYFWTASGTTKEIVLKENALTRNTFWHSSDVHSADDASTGVQFTYGATHGAGAPGPLFTIAGNTDNDFAYRFQLIGAYATNDMYFRTHNGNTNTWGSWLRLLSTKNISASSGVCRHYQVSVNTTSISDIKNALLDMHNNRSSAYPEFGGAASIIVSFASPNGSVTAHVSCNGANYFSALVFSYYYVGELWWLKYNNGPWVSYKFTGTPVS